MHARVRLTILIMSVSALFFIWLFLRDIAYFSLPRSFIGELYTLTALFFGISMALLMLILASDRTQPVESSSIRIMAGMILGFLWIADGILQAQPQMPFGFSHFVLQSSIDNLPGTSSTLLSPLLVTWNSHGIMFDSLAAAIQIFIGVALLTTRSRKWTGKIAIISILWGIGIWVFGEGMGNIFVSGLSLISGFPGAALIYVFLSVLLISNLEERAFSRALIALVASIFLVGAVVQALPFEGFWSYNALASIPGSFVLGFQPRLVGDALLYVAYAFQHHWVMWNAFFIAVFVILGVTWVFRPRGAALATMVLMPFLWLVGQDLGVFGMYGTDFNSAFPLILISAALFLFYREHVSPHGNSTRSAEHADSLSPANNE